jgi:alpha-L-fucosidase
MEGLTKDGGFAGDYGTPEQEIPDTGLPGVDWESCMTMNDTWGYKSDDDNWKSGTTLIRNLIDIASKGGNYLLNIGPTAEGLFPDASVERLKEIGAWMRVNSEAIYATSASPYEQPEWGRYTKKPGKLYAFIFDHPQKGALIIKQMQKPVKKIYLLADEKKNELKFESGQNGVTIFLPDKEPDLHATVVVIELQE